MNESYNDFLNAKAQAGGDHGFEAKELPSFLYDFQSSLLDWSLRKGRSAIFADCGLGKSPIELARRAGLKISTVQKWGKRGHIPSTHWPRLIEQAKTDRARMKLDLADFID